MKSQTTEFIELGRKQAELFNWDRAGMSTTNQSFINLLMTAYAFRQILVLAYKSLVSYKLITKIEDLPDDQKENLFKSTREFTGQLYGADKAKDMCRCLYTLEFYLQ